jgi:hypothetical protein
LTVEEEQMDTRFAEYATRVGFNLTLMKNQITMLQAIVNNIAYEKINGRQRPIDGDWRFTYPSHACTASRKLEYMGIIDWEDPGKMKPTWVGYPWSLTTVGKTVWSLLVYARIAQKPVISVQKVA